MKKILGKIYPILLACLLLGTLAACGSSKEEAENSSGLPKEINFGLQQMPNDEAIAISEGLFDKYFTEKGIKCNFITFNSDAVNAALASGDIDFGLMGSSAAAIALAVDIDVEMIWIHEVLGDIESLAIKNDSGINSLEDLVGKRVATPVASTAHYSLLHALEKAGISDKVEILDMHPADIVAAWERGDIEAAYVWQPALANLLKDGKILLSSEDMAAQGVVTSNVEVVSKKFSEKYPDLVAAYVACLTEAADMYREDPQNAAKIVGKHLEITPEEALTQMEGAIWLTTDELLSEKYFGASENKGELTRIMKEAGDFLEEQGSIDKSPSKEAFEAYVNPVYIEKSRELLKGKE